MRISAFILVVASAAVVGIDAAVHLCVNKDTKIAKVLGSKKACKIKTPKNKWKYIRLDNTAPRDGAVGPVGPPGTDGIGCTVEDEGGGTGTVSCGAEGMSSSLSVVKGDVLAGAVQTLQQQLAETIQRTQNLEDNFSVRLVFVTSTRYNGNLGDLDGADDKCQEAANNANLLGTFKAWLSNSTDFASTRFTKWPGRYVLAASTSTVIANSWDDLTDGTLQNAINVDENGQAIDQGRVWTSTNTDGTGSTFSRCTDWSNPTTGSGGSGQLVFMDSRWTSVSGFHCSELLHLYCFQQ